MSSRSNSSSNSNKNSSSSRKATAPTPTPATAPAAAAAAGQDSVQYPPQLQGPEQLPGVAQVQDKMDHNGNQLFATDPEKYMRIASMLAEGEPIGKIANRLKTSPLTVYAVQRREGVTISEGKAFMADLLSLGARVAVESTIDKIMNDEIPPGQLPIVAGIFIQRAQELRGEPNQRIEVTRKEMSQDDYNDIIANLPRKADIIDVVATTEDE
jgi:hypothetical protein